MKTRISAVEFDRKFDDGEDISEYIDWASASHPGLDPKRVDVELPTWMVNGLDIEAQRLGITRQALIRTWLEEKLK